MKSRSRSRSRDKEHRPYRDFRNKGNFDKRKDSAGKEPVVGEDVEY